MNNSSSHQESQDETRETSRTSIAFGAMDVIGRPRPQTHLGKHRQYWRDIILGVNDGLVSTFLLVAGVAGGGLSSIDILLTAVSGAIAGAVSMFAGEFLATKSQNEVLRGEIDLEKRHIQTQRAEEMSEVSSLLNLIGISNQEEELKEELVAFYDIHPDSLLQLMKSLEFGVIEEEQRSAVWAGITSCSCFIVGSLPSVIPFAFHVSSKVGLIYAAALTGATLIVVGMIKTWATRGSFWRASMENLAISGCGGGIAYGVGVLFDSLVRSA
jgi:VIT1/CCC1 family predicted Fe2+/Mn2+ transporter